MHVPKPVILVFIAACGLLGIGVATAAVGDDHKNENAADPTVPSSEVTTTVPTSTPETATPESGVPDTEAPDDDGDDGEGGGEGTARYYGAECGAEIAGGTHGDYVSRTAQEGGDVPTMAQSNCGKPLTSVHETTPPAAAPTEDDQERGPTDHPLGGPPGQTKDKGKPEKG